ncbi:MAG: GNAT family N-acetyltransferase [Lachnospiraceae bacterium]|nr:GNAT family N-acetyltransferase [Lachnospiraceae bacterium]
MTEKERSAGKAVRIREMTVNDLAGVLEVEKACFSEPWSEKVYRAVLLLDYTSYYVAEITEEGLSPLFEKAGLSGSRIVGTIGLKNIAGEGEVTNVAVLPSWRGCGIAGRLMERLLSGAAQDGIDTFTLEVRAGNVPAIRLYESFGFKAEGRRRDFYDRPREDALIYWKRP